MTRRFVLTDYVKQALNLALYVVRCDGSFAGNIPPCEGVIAFGATLPQCQEELGAVLEDWILVGLKMGHPLPVIAGIDLNRIPQTQSKLQKPSPAPRVPAAARLAEIIAGDVYNDRLDLSQRVDAPVGMLSPLTEFDPSKLIQGGKISDRDLRLFLTFISAMDRFRDATLLWRNGGKLFQAHPHLFEPSVVSALPLPSLRKLLSDYGVSQRHGPDSGAWRTIAQSLSDDSSSPVTQAIDQGVGQAGELLRDLQSKIEGRYRFPMLRGPRIGPMWVKLMADRGNTRIDDMDVIPVSVDVHVRRVTENLLITDSRDLPTSEATPKIQEAWRQAVAAAQIGGPPGIAGTCAAMDSALWFFGRHGCSHCNTVGRQVPISHACDYCHFPFPATTAHDRR